MPVFNPKHFPSLFKLGRSVAADADNISEDGRPQFVECGCCGHMHPINFGGDCRDDDNRFTLDQLDELYGEQGWAERYAETP
jgi:hypothetical protein